MTSGVMRASVRSRFRWRMISWPAAKQIRWVKPSIATVSPSRTSSPTASAIVVCLLVPAHPVTRDTRSLGAPAVLRAAQDAELVALGVEHHGPEAPALLDVAELPGAEPGHAGLLVRHRGRGSQIQVEAGLQRPCLGDEVEQDRPALPAGVAGACVLLIGLGHLGAQDPGPETRALHR